MVTLALDQGFRGIDTANQRKHYNEAAVGEGIREMINRGLIARRDLFIQTKFTQLHGQDHRLPYDPHSSLTDQVEQSFVSSLEHLGIEIIDCYVLHGPSTRSGLGRDDWAIWRAMENIYDSGRALILGVSNVTREHSKVFARMLVFGLASFKTDAMLLRVGITIFVRFAMLTK